MVMETAPSATLEAGSSRSLPWILVVSPYPTSSFVVSTRSLIVKADHIVELGGEPRIGRALDCAHAMGLELVSAPDPLHGGQRQSARWRHGAAGPMGDRVRRLIRK